MQETLSKYGITPQNALAPESVLKLHEIYEAKVAELSKAKADVDDSKEASAVKAEVERYSKDEELVRLAEIVELEIKVVLDRAFQWDSRVAYLLVDKFNGLTSQVRAERNFNRATGKTPTVSLPMDWTTTKEECEQIREAVKSLYKNQQMLGIDVELPMEDSKRGEGKSIKFTMLPRDSKEAESKQSYKSSRVVLTVDGTDYDQEMIRTCHDVIGITVQALREETSNYKSGVEHSVNGHTVTINIVK